MENRELAVRLANFYRDNHATRKDIDYWEDKLNDTNNDYLFNAMNSITRYVKVSADLYGMESAYPIAHLGRSLQNRLNDKVIEQLQPFYDDDKDFLREKIEDPAQRRLLIYNLEQNKGNIEPYVLQDLVRSLENYGDTPASRLFEDGVRDEEFLTKLTNGAIEMAAKMVDGDKSIKFRNYAADIKKSGSSISIAFSQFIDKTKEVFAKSEIDTEKKTAHIDFLKIPRALSAVALSGRDKIESMQKSFKDSVNKTFNIAKEAITAKFPKDYEADFSKVTNLGYDKALGSKSPAFKLDTNEIMETLLGAEHENMLSKKEIVDLFKRAQTAKSESGEKLNFHLTFSSAEKALNDAVKNGGIVRLYYEDAPTKVNQLKGNEENGSFRIEVTDPKHGSFEGYVPLTENESRQISNKVSGRVKELRMQEGNRAYEDVRNFGDIAVQSRLIENFDKMGYEFAAHDNGFIIKHNDSSMYVENISQAAQFALSSDKGFEDNTIIKLTSEANPEKMNAFAPLSSVAETITARNEMRHDVSKACADLLTEHGYFVTETPDNKLVLNKGMDKDRLFPEIRTEGMSTLVEVMNKMAELEETTLTAITDNFRYQSKYQGITDPDVISYLNTQINALETLIGKEELFTTPATADMLRFDTDAEKNTAQLKETQDKMFEGRE